MTEYGDLTISVDVTSPSEKVATAKEEVQRRTRRHREGAQTPRRVQLSIFNNRFMGIAEQMGRTLQRTQRQHQHQGASGLLVRAVRPGRRFSGERAARPGAPRRDERALSEWQLEPLGAKNGGLNEGDVLVTNHPQGGGSPPAGHHRRHPGVQTTVRSCSWWRRRGHHADVGGITPGSMPPFSRSIADEGAAIEAFKLVDAGRYDLEGITNLLTNRARRVPRDA